MPLLDSSFGTGLDFAEPLEQIPEAESLAEAITISDSWQLLQSILGHNGKFARTFFYARNCYRL